MNKNLLILTALTSCSVLYHAEAYSTTPPHHSPSNNESANSSTSPHHSTSNNEGSKNPANKAKRDIRWNKNHLTKISEKIANLESKGGNLTAQQQQELAQAKQSAAKYAKNLMIAEANGSGSYNGAGNRNTSSGIYGGGASSNNKGGNNLIGGPGSTLNPYLSGNSSTQNSSLYAGIASSATNVTSTMNNAVSKAPKLGKPTTNLKDVGKEMGSDGSAINNDNKEYTNAINAANKLINKSKDGTLSISDRNKLDKYLDEANDYANREGAAVQHLKTDTKLYVADGGSLDNKKKPKDAKDVNYQSDLSALDSLRDQAASYSIGGKTSKKSDGSAIKSDDSAVNKDSKNVTSNISKLQDLMKKVKTGQTLTIDERNQLNTYLNQASDAATQENTALTHLKNDSNQYLTDGGDSSKLNSKNADKDTSLATYDMNQVTQAKEELASYGY